MNPKITQALDSISKRFDEEFTEIVRENPRIVQKPDLRIKSFIHQSNLELLAAVRDIAEGMKQSEAMLKLPSASGGRERFAYNAALTDLLTALSEGKEKV